MCVGVLVCVCVCVCGGGMCVVVWEVFIPYVDTFVPAAERRRDT